MAEPPTFPPARIPPPKRVRAYERKFRNRQRLLDEVARVRRARRKERGGR
jgi:hypothetical protein